MARRLNPDQDLRRAIARIEHSADMAERMSAVERALAIIERRGEAKGSMLHASLLVQLGQLFGDQPARAGDSGDRARAAAHLKRALAMFPRRRARIERAHAQIVLANILSEGDERDFEQAIRLYRAALRCLRPRTDAEDWTTAQSNLGYCLVHRLRGDKKRNLAGAIKAYESLARFYQRRGQRQDWAATKIKLAIALSEFGAEPAGQERAIAAIEAALGVFTRRGAPMRWAECQNVLGALYYERIKGDRSDNIERAIAALQRALAVRTKKKARDEWLASMNNLALALSDRVRGGRADNLERALAALNQVVAACPRRSAAWARAQAKRAIILLERPGGVRARNIESAIGAGERAIGVFDPRRTPSEWAHATNVTANAYADRERGGRSQNIETAIAMFKSIRAHLDPRAFALDCATADLNLSVIYASRIEGARADNLEAAIGFARRALRVLNRQVAPLDWASLNANLGGFYFSRARGARRENLERAIAADVAALQVFTRAEHPIAWAGVKANLANAFRDRIDGDRRENLECALACVLDALEVLDAEAAPLDWAGAQQIFASVLLHRQGENRRSDLEEAIGAIERASEIFVHHGLGLEWAKARATLATLYLERVEGARADNVERAFLASSEALSRLSSENEPVGWANAMSDLAVAYSERSRGDRADNIERAITHIRGALAVLSRDHTPFEWARAQANLATLFILREEGVQTENLSRAVRALGYARTVMSRRRAPGEWAQLTMNLAVAVQRLDAGEGGGLNVSIRLFEEALSVLSAVSHPQDWAMAKVNLANALRWRAETQGEDDARRAAKAYREALTVVTPERFPEEHVRAARLLATTLSGLGEWDDAGLMFARARAAAFSLIGVGLHAGERERVLAEVARLGPDSAYAKLRAGDAIGALTDLEAGRALELALWGRLGETLTGRDRVRLRRARRTALAAEQSLAAAAAPARRAALGKLMRAQNALATLAGAASSTDGLKTQLRQLIGADTLLIAPVLSQAGAAVLRARWRGKRLIIDSAPIAAPKLPTTGEAPAAMGPSVRLVAPQGQAAADRAWQIFAAGVDGAESRLIVMAPGAEITTPALAEKAGVSLVERCEITHAPSMTAACNAARRCAVSFTPSLGAIIDPGANLSGAMVEHNLAAHHFGARHCAGAVGQGATRAAAAAALRDKSYWLIATHGRFDSGRAGQSWLALAGDERLSLEDALFLRRPKHLRLAVLSACESGAHDDQRRPEEFEGFVNAFLQLGAVGVVAAKWPVDDVAAAFVIGRFFEHHLGEGDRPAKALQKAQLWLRQASVYQLHTMMRRRAASMTQAQRRAAQAVRLRLDRYGGEATPFSDTRHWAGYALYGA